MKEDDERAVLSLCLGDGRGVLLTVYVVMGGGGGGVSAACLETGWREEEVEE